jgi:hypothetical protein
MTAVPFPYGQPRKKASPAPSVLLLYLMRRVDCRACGERVEETAVGDREAPADQGLYARQHVLGRRRSGCEFHPQ